MKKGEKISLCCEEKGKEYICSIEDMQSDIVKAVIVDINGESRELPVKITLFQGLPKNWYINSSVPFSAFLRHAYIITSFKKYVNLLFYSFGETDENKKGSL